MKKSELRVRFEGIKNNFEQQRDDHLDRAKELQKSLKAIQVVINECDQVVCPDCKGHGKLRVFIAQDSSRLETCKACKGSGMKDSE